MKLTGIQKAGKLISEAVHVLIRHTCTVATRVWLRTRQHSFFPSQNKTSESQLLEGPGQHLHIVMSQPPTVRALAHMCTERWHLTLGLSRVYAGCGTFPSIHPGWLNSIQVHASIFTGCSNRARGSDCPPKKCASPVFRMDAGACLNSLAQCIPCDTGSRVAGENKTSRNLSK